MAYTLFPFNANNLMIDGMSSKLILDMIQQSIGMYLYICILCTKRPNSNSIILNVRISLNLMNIRNS